MVRPLPRTEGVLIPEERRRRLLGIVTSEGATTIAVLTEKLGVSHMTVRRDIHLLEEAGRVVSVSGGVTLPARIALDDSHATKLGIRPQHKRAIAESAAHHARPGSVIYLDAGTTMLAVAQRLVDRADLHPLQVVTNDLAVAEAVGARLDARVHLAGGRLDARNMATEGPTAASAIRALNIDIAFVSASSFDLRGLSVPTEDKAVVKAAVIEASAHALLVTDSSKYGRVAAHRAASLTAFDTVITDDELPAAAVEHIQQNGIALEQVATDDHKGEPE